MKEEVEKEKDMNCEDGLCEVEPSQSAPDAEIKMTTNDNTLIYIGDPMCSWCWGITNHLDRLKDEYGNQLSFELILGGLRPGGGEDWTPEFREMIRSHWEHVHEASGQPFDYRFFDREEFNYDTEPPARAVRVVRDIAPDKEWTFYKSLQRMFYAENRDLDDLNELEKLCVQLDIDYAQFEPLFLSPGYKQLVNQDFMRAQQMGIRGFPSVVLKKGEEYYAVSMGYSDYNRMRAVVEKVLVAD